MKEMHPSQQYRVKINQPVIDSHDSVSQIGQKKIKINDLKREQNKVQSIRKSQSSSSKTEGQGTSLILKRELLRLLLIPLLIVLFLLTIALTFKQNNYQTNDYFYSKNIQINRKIRGVVPPLNETKQNIFGEYQIGLVQSFSIQNRRMFEDLKVELWRNESMRISEIGKEDKCWGLYRLKFYSSTIFIEKIQSQLAKTSATNNTRSTLENSQSVTTNDAVNQINSTNIQNNSSSSSDNTNTTTAAANSSTLNTSANSSTFNQTSQTAQSIQTNPAQQSICKLDKWSKLNEILSNSHIWTFAEGNFYLMEFSQIGDDGNGVLIMKMIYPYLRTL